MLTFSPAQINSFQTRWQIEQLQAQLPCVLSRLAENHPDFYRTNQAHQHHYHGKKLIEQAVSFGYTHLEHIQQLMDLQYQARQNIYAQNPIRLLYQADWLQAQDRINAIDYLRSCSLIATEIHHPYLIPMSTYGLLDDYSRDKRCQDIDTLTILDNTEDSRTACIQLLQQGFYHALLKQALQNTSGWHSWDSDWQQASIGIEHRRHQRRIRLQPLDDLNATAVQATTNDSGETVDEPALLTLHIPHLLNSEQHARLNDILHAWAEALLPAAALRKRFIWVDKETSAPTQASHDQGE